MKLADCMGMVYNGGMEWWNGIVECILQGERSLLMHNGDSS